MSSDSKIKPLKPGAAQTITSLSCSANGSGVLVRLFPSSKTSQFERGHGIGRKLPAFATHTASFSFFFPSLGARPSAPPLPTRERGRRPSAPPDARPSSSSARSSDGPPPPPVGLLLLTYPSGALSSSCSPSSPHPFPWPPNPRCACSGLGLGNAQPRRFLSPWRRTRPPGRRRSRLLSPWTSGHLPGSSQGRFFPLCLFLCCAAN